MNRFISGIMIAGMVATGLSGCGAKEQQDKTAEETAVETVNEEPKVEIVYSSAVAAGKPAFADDDSRVGPFRMMDGRKVMKNPELDQVDIADIGAYELNGRRRRMLDFINASQDTLRVDSVLLPDDRFEAEWQYSHPFLPGMSSGIVLYSDDSEYIEDYKIVIVYKNEGIEPQTFHVNIHPDIHKLHADYAASQQE